MSDTAVEISLVSKRFDAVVALDQLSLTIPSGAVVTLLGPSGSGKTTALRLVAGFDRPDSGTVDVSGQKVVGDSLFVAPERRRVGVVFQDYALFPHLDVAGNVGYGLGRGTNRAARVGETLEMVGLAGLHGRFPHELSGGQQQRVALARAVAPRPAVILLDEPFSNLDASLRSMVRSEVLGIVRASGITAVFITHDQEEALSMSDLVAVMDRGRIVQVASPHDLYLRPLSEWVGTFLGDANFASGRARSGSVSTNLGVFSTEIEGEVRVMVRPESVSLMAESEGRARVVQVEFFGHDQLVTVCLEDGTLVRSRMGPGDRWSPGDKVDLHVDQVTAFPIYSFGRESAVSRDLIAEPV